MSNLSQTRRQESTLLHRLETLPATRVNDRTDVRQSYPSVESIAREEARRRELADLDAVVAFAHAEEANSAEGTSTFRKEHFSPL